MAFFAPLLRWFCFFFVASFLLSCTMIHAGTPEAVRTDARKEGGDEKTWATQTPSSRRPASIDWARTGAAAAAAASRRPIRRN